MAAHRPNFSNLNDGIDWINALPPHIVAQQERLRVSNARDFPHSMFMQWPIPEDILPSHSALRRVQGSTLHSTRPSEAQSRGSRRALIDLRIREGARELERDSRSQAPPQGGRNTVNTPQVRSQARGSIRQQQHQRPQQHSQIIPEDLGLPTLASLASTMLNIHHSEAMMAFDEFLATQVGIAEAAAAAMAREQGRRSSMLETMELRNGEGAPGFTRVLVSVRASSSEAPQVTAHVERGVLQPRQRGHHINSSGSNFDIITGWSRVPRSGEGNVNGGTRRGTGNDNGWEINDFSYENLLRLDNGVKKTGLSQSQLRHMKPVPYAAVQPLDDTKSGRRSSSQEACAICLETLAPGVMVLKIECGHTFHHNCIVRWLLRSNCCPTCRHEIPRIGQTR
ncbi:putative zinc finger protein [Trypanosoma theileri]|uniref:RING-type E3 ubiquitin transferase n=1 Tax=Trypanosoma theileri TaxID=67003 RepID=A0A1X0NJE6_9TRYP|nr:putative zinc finger protein [Trypanosoma theileri]ORC84711.1 putative zinc finger protein [Trypanosoma theileri]